MAINKNHEFEDLDGVKCAIVERNVTAERAGFLSQLLGMNGYTVKVIAGPPAKPGVAPPVPEGDAVPLFTVGVTDVMFNAVNAIFGRALRTQDGQVVTLAYWQQKQTGTGDDIPYFESNGHA